MILIPHQGSQDGDFTEFKPLTIPKDIDIILGDIRILVF